MSLQKLDIYRVRNIQQASITPCPALNLIYGRNGSGKSALLESIFILGRAASFRTSQVKHVINHQADDLVVSGQVLLKSGACAHLGVQLSNKQNDIHINLEGKRKRSELAYALPIQLIQPTSYQLLDGGATLRREFMDWGIFNQDEHFLALWRRFKKALAQRNTLLKTQSLRQLSVWDRELVLTALPVAQYRHEYIRELQPVFLQICQLFFDFTDIQLAAFAGWDEQKDLQELLNHNVEKDCRYGYTQHGPHRGDFTVLINQRLAKDFVSRGQLKLLVLALKLAQVQLLHTQVSKIGCILIDDVVAELDLPNRTKLLHYLALMEFQVFLTASELSEFGSYPTESLVKVFHVEHGRII